MQVGSRDGPKNREGMLAAVSSLFSFFFLRATSVAYGSSQARGLIEAAAAGLCHSNVGPELHLQPTPQLMAILVP